MRMEALLTAETVGPYLVDRGLVPAGSRVTAHELGGGVSNVVLAVDGAIRAVVKQSLPRLRVEEEWLAKRERALTEAAALALVDRLTPGAVPTVLDVDTEACALTIERAPDGWRSWKSDLLEGDADPEVAARLGTLLATWHRETDGDEQVAREFSDVEAFEQLRIDPYHRAVMRRWPRLARAIGAHVDRLLSTRETLVHGDFSPKNVLVAPGRAEASDGGSGSSPSPIWIIDFEVAHLGDPSFDVAFLLSHLALKAIHLPASERELLACADAFDAAYRGAAPPFPVAPAAYILGHVGCLMLARVDGKSPAEYLDGPSQARARTIARSLITAPPGSLAGLGERDRGIRMSGTRSSACARGRRSTREAVRRSRLASTSQAARRGWRSHRPARAPEAARSSSCATGASASPASASRRRWRASTVRSPARPSDSTPAEQEHVDSALRSVDGTSDLQRLGGNAVVAVSLAAAVAASNALGMPLYRMLAGPDRPVLPLPMVNVISGGAHARGRHRRAGPARRACRRRRPSPRPSSGRRACATATASVAARAWARGTARRRRGRARPGDRVHRGGARAAGAGDLAQRAPAGRGCGHRGRRRRDPARAGPWHVRLAEPGRRAHRGRARRPHRRLARAYPIVSIEDPLADDDWSGWAQATRRLDGLQLVGDDLLVTDPDRLERAIAGRIANAVLVKPNQVGTVSDAARVVRDAQEAGYATVVSARSGDTEESWLADLAVGWRAGQIKVGSTTRSERTAKWNRLLEIESELGDDAVFAGQEALSGRG